MEVFSLGFRNDIFSTFKMTGSLILLHFRPKYWKWTRKFKFPVIGRQASTCTVDEVDHVDGPSNKEKNLKNILKGLIDLLGPEDRAKDIHELIAKLFSKNYPEVEDWNGDTKLQVFIPERYLNKAAKYVDPKRGDQLLDFCENVVQSNPERKKEFEKHCNDLIGPRRNYQGQVPKQNLYIALKEYCLDSNDSVAVFQGLNVLKYNSSPKQDPNEKDFILVNPTHGYIVGIKTIKTFGKGRNMEKQLQRLHDTKGDLETFLASGILKDQWIINDWVYIPMVYCEEMLDSLNVCPDCTKLIIIGIF